VSRSTKSYDSQRSDLEDYCKRQGWQNARWFTDTAAIGCSTVIPFRWLARLPRPNERSSSKTSVLKIKRIPRCAVFRCRKAHHTSHLFDCRKTFVVFARGMSLRSRIYSFGLGFNFTPFALSERRNPRRDDVLKARIYSFGKLLVSSKQPGEFRAFQGYSGLFRLRWQNTKLFRQGTVK
jgi:hypothetical protein